MAITLHPERADDVDAIFALTAAAFQTVPYASGTEPLIVNALRARGQLTVSLVARDGDTVVGHLAVSPVTISSGAAAWFGLGPLSVAPAYQRRGIGSLLMREGLAQLARIGAQGCVLLGDPAYYGRFGFRAGSGLTLPGVPAEYFQALSLGGPVPCGVVCFDPAFDVQA